MLTHYAQQRDVKPSTIDTYLGVIRQFKVFLGRDPRANDLSRDIVNAWLSCLQQTLSPFTADSRRMTILSLWNVAHSLGMVDRPDGIRTIKKPDILIRTLSSQQIELVILICRNLAGTMGALDVPRRDYMTTWVQMTLETSLRPSDMVRIKWPELRDSDGMIQLVQRKTGYRRYVRVSGSLLDLIRCWHGPSGDLFARVGSSTISHTIKRVGRQAGVHWLNHTALRRTSITAVESVAPGSGWIFAGHRSPATTRRWYTDADRLAQAIQVPEFTAFG